MKKILVTGAAGFIGFHSCKALIARGDKVIGVDNISGYYSPKLKKNRLKELKHSNFTFYKTDIADFQQMKKIFQLEKVDKVLHLAAQAGVRYSIQNPFEYEKTNNLGTMNLFELCKKFNVKVFVFASSSSVYGGNKKIPFSEKDKVDRPISVYAATKRYNEALAYTYHHLYSIKCTGLRFFTVYGPWGRPDMALFKFTKAILNDKPIDVYNYGKMKRDFTYIDDAVQGTLAALDKEYEYEIFNIGNSNIVELMRFIQILEDLLGKKAKMNLLPMQAGDVPETCADISKAQKLLGYNPKTKVEEGIRKFVEWYKKEEI